MNIISLSSAQYTPRFRLLTYWAKIGVGFIFYFGGIFGAMHVVVERLCPRCAGAVLLLVFISSPLSALQARLCADAGL